MTSTASTSPAAVDLNSTTSTPADVSVPAILFAIPFPPASHPREDAASVAKRPAFLLYSPPRAVYRRPQAAAGDAKPKENLVKKFESKWQEEVAQGNAIGRGAVHDPSVWQKTKGVLTRNASKVIQWLPDSNIEALSRIPPKKKILREATLFMPEDRSPEPTSTSPASTPQEEIQAQLQRTRKGALTKTIASGALLPVAGVLDWFCPIFAFEVDVAYFSAHLQGLRKATALSSPDIKLRLEPSPHLFALQQRLHTICNSLAPGQFPGSKTPVGFGGKALAEAVVAQFRAAVPPEVAARHALDDMKALAEDVDRCLRKGAQEYVKTL